MTDVRIRIGSDHEALISEADLATVELHKWHVLKLKKHVYARTMVKHNGRWVGYPMHRLLMGLQPGERVVVDHINHDGLDNRRENLRIVSYSENALNRRDGKIWTGRIGVFKNGSGWIARITHEGQRFALGTYQTEREAAIAYDAAALVLRGRVRQRND